MLSFILVGGVSWELCGSKEGTALGQRWIQGPSRSSNCWERHITLHISDWEDQGIYRHLFK
jgi:hypothetical protein